MKTGNKNGRPKGGNSQTFEKNLKKLKEALKNNGITDPKPVK